MDYKGVPTNADAMSESGLPSQILNMATQTSVTENSDTWRLDRSSDAANNSKHIYSELSASSRTHEATITRAPSSKVNIL